MTSCFLYKHYAVVVIMFIMLYFIYYAILRLLYMLKQPASLETSLFFFSSFTFLQQSISEKDKDVRAKIFHSIDFFKIFTAVR